VAPGTPAIEVDGLERRFGGRRALRDVSLTVPAGATLAVLGPNGAGKTTLLRVLAGLLRPHAGRVAVRGRVGLLGHEPLLYRELTARENLRYHARLHGVGAGRVDAALDAVGLADRADDRVGDLSRGLLQRAAAARTVLHDPEVLLLDEPYANLDPAAQERLAPLLGAASGRTRVLTSHDAPSALREADLALGLRGGRVALLGAAAEADVGALYA
jgi:heme exporter protein A